MKKQYFFALVILLFCSFSLISDEESQFFVESAEIIQTEIDNDEIVLETVSESEAEDFENTEKNLTKSDILIPEEPEISENESSFAEYSSAECDLNHEENSPLFFGNPSDSAKNVVQEDNYFIEKTQFDISYNNQKHCPNWVGWHLCGSDLGEADRSNKFKPDSDLPDEWYKITQKDYQYNAYGFDRGHICPSADRTASQTDNEITFLMTNMVPQAPDCNRITWRMLEEFERDLADSGNEIYIFAGPAGIGGTGNKGYFEEIPVEMADGSKISISVPEYTWKIMLVLPEGQEDFQRINENTTVIAACVPNQQGCNKEGSWKNYVCSVDYIEELTGYNFFELLPDETETALEAGIWHE